MLYFSPCRRLIVHVVNGTVNMVVHTMKVADKHGRETDIITYIYTFQSTPLPQQDEATVYRGLVSNVKFLVHGPLVNGAQCELFAIRRGQEILRYSGPLVGP